MTQHIATAVQAVEAQPVTERVMPGHDTSAELKLYSSSPHAVDQHDVALTTLSSSIGMPCSKAYIRLVLHDCTLPWTSQWVIHWTRACIHVV